MPIHGYPSDCFFPARLMMHFSDVFVVVEGMHLTHVARFGQLSFSDVAPHFLSALFIM
jgi:hypothetical protein